MVESSVKIEEPEIMTSTAIRRIEELFKELSANMRKDLKNFSSEMFFCVIIHDNGYYRNDLNFAEWKTDSARIVYKNGEIILSAFRGMEEDYDYEVELSEFWRIQKLDFSAFMEEFLKFIELYNEFSKEKDEEIKEFLEKLEFTEIY
jgi:hypothetical protein